MLAGCSSTPRASRTATSQTLDLKTPTSVIATSKAYLDYYGLLAGHLSEEVQYFSGALSINEQQLSSHLFIPSKPVGTVFVLHGYFDHVGSLNHIINAALGRQYAVFAYDLPGHGLSSGNRGDISGFTDNAVLLNNIVDKYKHTLPKPFHLIGFSTGGSIAFENTRLKGNSLFDKTVLVAPLLRHTHWRWGKTAYTLFGPFLTTVRSRDKANSSNTQYLEFAKQDPMRNSHVSFRFLRDLYFWNRVIVKAKPSNSNVLVIQGELDKVVDWRYNLPLLEKKLNKSQIYKVSQGKHQLFNEVKSVREQVFTRLFQFLESTNAPEL